MLNRNLVRMPASNAQPRKSESRESVDMERRAVSLPSKKSQNEGGV